jgi:glycosyltransferase involved in cell wall biosynthesis
LKQALIIAYQFPPHGGGGVQRTTKFLKYLPVHGWQGTVLTGQEKARQPDPSLDTDIPPGTRIERVRGLLLPRRPSRLRQWLATWVLTVDAELGWLPAAVQRGTKVLRSDRYAVIYSTSAPYTDHLVGLQLKGRFQLPWVADFRDPWTNNIHDLFPTRFHRRICERLEAAVIAKADRVLVVSEPMRQQFMRQYPQIEPTHFVTVTNGYDSADYKDATAHDLPTDKFHLIYTGSLYGQRSAQNVLTAIRRLLDTKILSADQLCFWVIGAYGQEAPQLVAAYGLEGVVQLVKYIPHDELIRYQLAADALLLIIAEGARSEIVLTGKLFEYLAVQKPILAVVPPGAAADLLTEANVGVIVPPNDIDAITTQVATLFQAWQHQQLTVTPNHAVIERCERRQLTSKLAAIFDELT